MLRHVREMSGQREGGSLDPRVKKGGRTPFPSTLESGWGSKIEIGIRFKRLCTSL